MIFSPTFFTVIFSPSDNSLISDVGTNFDKTPYIVVTETQNSEKIMTNSNNHFIVGSYNDIKIYEATNLKHASYLYLGLDNDADNILGLISIQDYFFLLPKQFFCFHQVLLFH